MKTLALKSVLIGLAVLMASSLTAVPVGAEEKKTTIFSVLEQVLGSSSDGSTASTTDSTSESSGSTEATDAEKPEVDIRGQEEKTEESSNPISITLDRKTTEDGFSPEVLIKTPSWERKLKANIKQKSTPGRINIEGVIEGIGALFKIQQTDDRTYKLKGGMEGQKPFEIEAKFN
jgi:hypothetical protein